MAIVSLTSTQAKFNNITSKALVAETSTTDGIDYLLSANDEQTILVVYNADAAAVNVTIKAPTNKVNTSALSDKVVSVPAGEVALLLVESAKYKDASTGKVKVVAADVDAKFALFHAKGYL